MVEGQRPMEDAREIKSADEVECMRAAIAACEAGMARMHDALRGGMTENQLWAILHRRTSSWGRMDRDPAAQLGAAHQPVVARVERSGDSPRVSW